jgi:hypothetical protein
MEESKFLEKNRNLFQSIVTSFLSFCLSYFYVKELPFQDNDLFSDKIIIFELFKGASQYQPNIDRNHNSHHHLT